jgi:uncharacterized protein
MLDHDVEIYKQIRKAIKEGKFTDVVSLVGTDLSSLRMETPFGTWLHMACSHGQIDIVTWLVSQGAEIDSIGGVGGRRPIDEAAASGNSEIVHYLIEAGATLDVSNSLRNPLFSAIVGGLSESHTTVAKVLIDAGIDTTIRYPNLDNMDALEYAKEWGRSDIVTLLEAKSN